MSTTCNKGHSKERGKKCRDCACIYNREYRRAHPELREYNRQYYKTNKSRCLKNAQRWKDKNPDRTADATYRRLYGISKAERDAMIAAQEGCCALCNKIPTTTLHVDHDHVTGKVRQMLCRRCNHQLGWIEKHHDLVTRMFDYLKKHKAK